MKTLWWRRCAMGASAARRWTYSTPSRCRSIHPLRTLENVVLTPHMGYVSAESFDQFFRLAIANVEAYLDGRVPAGAMNPEVLKDGKLRRKSAVSEA